MPEWYWLPAARGQVAPWLGAYRAPTMALGNRGGGPGPPGEENDNVRATDRGNGPDRGGPRGDTEQVMPSHMSRQRLPLPHWQAPTRSADRGCRKSEKSVSAMTTRRIAAATGVQRGTPMPRDRGEPSMTHTGPVRDHRTRDNRTDNDSYISRIGRFGPVRSTHSVARIVSSRRSVDDWIVSSRGLAPDRVRRGPSVIAHEAPGDIVTVGTQPEGWGVSINWNTDQDMAIVAFINSSSVDGLRVTGVRDGDTFQLDTASGSATYAVDTENEGIPGLISVVAVGANVAAGVFGQAELSPLINSAAQYARQQFPERQVNAKSRDAFGVDRNGGFAQQEGGVIVCAPAAHQFYYSGSDSDEGRRRWVQGNGRRTPENFPRHIVAGTAFFLRAEAPVQSLYGTGSMILGAWDGQDAFRDNFGFYEVSFILRRGQAGSWPNGPVPLREQARATKGVRKFSGNVRAAKRNSPAMR